MHEYDPLDIVDNYVIPDDEDLTNILNFKMFDNLQAIKIYGVQCGNQYFSFSFYHFRSLLTQTKIKKVEISVFHKADDDSSWLLYLWNKESLSIIKQCRNTGYSIHFDNDYGNSHTHHISITLL